MDNTEKLKKMEELYYKAATALASVWVELSGPENPLSPKTQQEIVEALRPKLMGIDAQF